MVRPIIHVIDLKQESVGEDAHRGARLRHVNPAIPAPLRIGHLLQPLRSLQTRQDPRDQLGTDDCHGDHGHDRRAGPRNPQESERDPQIDEDEAHRDQDHLDRCEQEGQCASEERPDAGGEQVDPIGPGEHALIPALPEIQREDQALHEEDHSVPGSGHSDEGNERRCEVGIAAARKAAFGPDHEAAGVARHEGLRDAEGHRERKDENQREDGRPPA